MTHSEARETLQAGAKQEAGERRVLSVSHGVIDADGELVSEVFHLKRWAQKWAQLWNIEGSGRTPHRAAVLTIVEATPAEVAAWETEAPAPPTEEST